jgi:hypothetical protein
MPENVITLELAQAWARRFNANPNILLGIKAFTIPGSNIRNVMAPGVVDTRTYFGINDEGSPVLMMVGVDENGNDMIDDKNGLYVYDFTKPCPPNCNLISPFINSGK